ncbi:MAG: ribulose 1,5-bisphosphate carboxylase [Alphaproteobacteria bacterium 64-11]|nr:ribulose 1,5-bisphosphate carboxylase [Alphaproteobacteria bacterium]OJU10907.1 MAG: ribulose 1,5-bisphosphate carboxylase [Alphaproteobacteria bacterium 64-11]
MSADRITAIYHVTDSADRIAARADAIAVEQSVEMPVSAISDRNVLDNIVGKVEDISDIGGGKFEVRIGLAVATMGPEPGQLMNMLFGNSSIHADIELHDAVFPDSVLSAFGGPNHGLAGMRARVGAKDRALTCSALKPQGLDGKGLAKIAGQLAKGGLDYIKDDHGIADQHYSPFAERVPAIADAVRAARAADGGRTAYLPSLSGNLDQMRIQIDIARKAGLDGVLIAPMIAGVATFHALVRENPDMAFMAHPALAGASRIAPPLHLGKIFRLFGADATVFPNHGGRFGYSPVTCRTLADAALAPWDGLRDTVPVPAGGMTPDRVPEMLQFYGRDVMLLIGGGLLAAGSRMADEAAKFQDVVMHG